MPSAVSLATYLDGVKGLRGSLLDFLRLLHHTYQITPAIFYVPCLKRKFGKYLLFLQE